MFVPFQSVYVLSYNVASVRVEEKHYAQLDLGRIKPSGTGADRFRWISVTLVIHVTLHTGAFQRKG